MISAFRRESQLQHLPDEFRDPSFRRLKSRQDDLPTSGSGKKLATGLSLRFSDQEMEHQFREWYEEQRERASSASTPATEQARGALTLLVLTGWFGVIVWQGVLACTGPVVEVRPGLSLSDQDMSNWLVADDAIHRLYLVALAYPLLSVVLSRVRGGSWNQLWYAWTCVLNKGTIITIGVATVVHGVNNINGSTLLTVAPAMGAIMENATLPTMRTLEQMGRLHLSELLVLLGGLGAYLSAFDLATTHVVFRRILLHCAINGALVLGFLSAVAVRGTVQLTGQEAPLTLAFALPLALVAPTLLIRWLDEMTLRRLFAGMASRMRRGSLEPPANVSASGGATAGGPVRPDMSGRFAERSATLRAYYFPEVPEAEDQDLELIEEIGQGAFGPVMRGRYKSETVAVKIFRRGAVANVEQHFTREANTMRLLRHPNVVSLFAVAPRLQDGASMALVCEFAPAGSLQDQLTNSEFTWDSARERIVLDIARGMNYLHHFLSGCAVIHHDLKPANVLIGANLEAKINDFGVSMVVARPAGADATEMVSPDPKARITVGSPIWLAPEVHRAESYNEKIDVYAFSLVLCEALVGDGLFVVKSYSATGQPLTGLCSSGFRPAIPESLREAMPGVVQLIEACWAESSEARPAFSQIVTRLAELAQRRASEASAAHAHAPVGPKLPLPTLAFEPAQELEQVQAQAQATGQDQAPRVHVPEHVRGREPLQPQTLLTQPLMDQHHNQHQQRQHAQGLGTAFKESPKHAPPRMGPNGAYVHSGRSYSHVSLSDPSVMAKVTREFQSEMSEQAAKYEEKLLAQKRFYEEKLSQIAGAVL